MKYKDIYWPDTWVFDHPITRCTDHPIGDTVFEFQYLYLRFYKDSMHPFAQPGQEFVGHRTRFLSDNFGAERVSIVGAVKQDFSANACSFYLSNVNLDLVHADSSHDGYTLAFD